MLLINDFEIEEVDQILPANKKRFFRAANIRIL